MTEIPPVIRLIESEDLLQAGSPSQLESKLKRSGATKELRRQAEWTVSHHEYRVDAGAGFVVAPSGSLNPFSNSFKCSSLECRLHATDNFVKTLALFTDEVIVPDPVTGAFMQDEIDHVRLFKTLAVYRRLQPLVNAGVLSFASPVRHLCKGCMSRAQRQASAAAEVMLMEAEQNVTVEIRNDGLAITCPLLFADPRHPLTYVPRLQPSEIDFVRQASASHDQVALNQIGRDLLSKRLKHLASQSLFELGMAQNYGASVLSSARAELLCFTESDGHRPNTMNVENWENARTVSLPWIGELTPSEAIVLREEAKTSLPRLRALLAKNLNGTKPSDVTSVVADLRAQAAECQAEVQMVRGLGENRYRLATEGLGVSLVVYGLASATAAAITAGLAGFLAALAHAQTAAHETANRKLRVQSSPAYALVKAREIIERRGTKPNLRLQPTRAVRTPRRRSPRG
ncbi:MAG: hypothetical protein U0Q11_11270 [Vicinamibacterales bacterium]